MISSAVISSAVSTMTSSPPLFIQNLGAISPQLMTSATYLTISNIIYLSRRSHLRQMPKRQLWKIRTTREPGVSIPLFLTIVFVWQSFVLFFPIVETVCRIALQRVSFFYSYPNAGGFGIILEPLNVQDLKQSARAKKQVRFDWHRFSLNVGAVGRDGYRHPPVVVRNLPHIDAPQRGMKHWPWRRKWKCEDRNKK